MVFLLLCCLSSFIYYIYINSLLGFPDSSVVKNPPAMQETQGTPVQSLGREDPLEKGMATHSSIFAWEIHGQRSLAGHSPYGQKESDTSEHTQKSLLDTRFVNNSVGYLSFFCLFILFIASFAVQKLFSLMWSYFLFLLLLLVLFNFTHNLNILEEKNFILIKITDF